MALLFTSPFASLSSSSSTSILPASPLLRFCKNSIVLQPKSYFGCKIQSPFVLNNRDSLIVKASSDVDGTSSTPPTDSTEEKVSVENLPLESKIQLKLEQQTRMKLAKKIRLRRKRLVRKRHLRKKGRWPPSKMKKNKNV